MVPVMFGSAVRAHPLADAKPLHLNLPMPVARAQLAGREDARDTSHHPPVPCRFILKHIEKTPPRGIGNGFGKLAVFLHAPHTQILHVHHLVFTDRAGGQLMQEIVPAIGDFFMKTAHSEATFLFHTPLYQTFHKRQPGCPAAVAPCIPVHSTEVSSSSFLSSSAPS